MKPKKRPPLHQLVRRKGLTQHDAHELMRFREYLKSKRTRADYLRLYPEEGQDREN